MYFSVLKISIREASKKASSSTQNKGRGIPKRRGIKVQHGGIVSAGTILVRQRRIQFHPGLHVSVGY